MRYRGGMKPPQPRGARQLPHWERIWRGSWVIGVFGEADGSLRWSGEFHAPLGRFATTCVAPADRACGEGARGGGGGPPELRRPPPMNHRGASKAPSNPGGHRWYRATSAVIAGSGAYRRSSMAPNHLGSHRWHRAISAVIAGSGSLSARRKDNPRRWIEPRRARPRRPRSAVRKTGSYGMILRPPEIRRPAGWRPWSMERSRESTVRKKWALQIMEEGARRRHAR